MSRPFLFRPPAWLRVAAVLAWIASFAVPAVAQEPAGFLVGVNLANPQWLSAADRAAALDQLSGARVAVVRFPLVPPSGDDYGPSIEFIRRVAARGIGVVLILYLEYPPGTPTRPKVPAMPEMWPEPALSAADAGLFRAKYGKLLGQIDKAGVKLAAIELGNEINWTAFNGEFAIPGHGRVLNLKELTDDPLGRRIAVGYRAYIRTAAALKAIRDALAVNRKTPILLAGLSDWGPEGQRPGAVLDSVSVPATIAYMREHGLDLFVDGYGVHTYPEVGQTPDQRRDAFERNVLAACGGAGKPCWLTEWGFPTRGTACGTDDRQRAALVGEMRELFTDVARTGRLKAAIYFQWRGDKDPLGIYRCGTLAPSGALAVAPLEKAAR